MTITTILARHRPLLAIAMCWTVVAILAAVPDPFSFGVGLLVALVVLTVAEAAEGAR